MTNFTNTGKKKIAAIGACAVLALAIGTTTAFAAVGARDNGPVLVKTENGSSSYSTDEGQTWNNGLPDGAVFIQNDDGGSTVTMGTPPALGEGRGLMGRNENGVTSYSTDGGKTWSDSLPDGFEEVKDPSGAAGIRSKGTALIGDGIGSMLVRNEDGKMSYSTDGGKTWTEGAPEGATITNDAEGRGFVTMGTPPTPGDGDSFMGKMTNGVESYSTDGGKTWSEKLPDGVTKNADGSVSFKK